MTSISLSESAGSKIQGQLRTPQPMYTRRVGRRASSYTYRKSAHTAAVQRTAGGSNDGRTASVARRFRRHRAVIEQARLMTRSRRDRQDTGLGTKARRQLTVTRRPARTGTEVKCLIDRHS